MKKNGLSKLIEKAKQNLSMPYDELTSALHLWSKEEMPNIEGGTNTLNSIIEDTYAAISRIDGKTIDFLKKTFDEQAADLLKIFEWLDHNRKEAFEWLQDNANKYNIKLDILCFENKIDDIKEDLKKRCEESDYMMDLANIAIALKLGGRTKSFDIKSNLMKVSLKDFLMQRLDSLDKIDLPPKSNIKEVQNMFATFLSDKKIEYTELVCYVQRMFVPLYKKSDVKEWLEGFIPPNQPKTHMYAFIYDVLLHLKLIKDCGYNRTIKEKYDIVKNI